MVSEILPGIYVLDHAVAEGKNAIILGQREAWAVDCGTFPCEGQEMVDFIRGRGHAPSRLIYTHGHGDHVLGSACFQGAEIFAHRLTPAEMRRLIPVWAQRADRSPEELSSQIGWPTVTFRDELWVDLGNRHLHLFPTPGHSQDGISIYLPVEKLLIAGDSVVTGIVPAIGDGDSVILERSLRRLAGLDIHLLVPGHGPVLFGPEEVQDWLRWLPAYLSRVRTFVQQALGRGIPADEIPSLCDYDRFIGDRLPSDRHNMVRRHRATVGKIVLECQVETAR